MGFSRQEYWSGLPCPPPGDFPDPGIEPASLMSPALGGGFYTTRATWETLFYSSPMSPLRNLEENVDPTDDFFSWPTASVHVRAPAWRAGPVLTNLHIQSLTNSCHTPGSKCGAPSMGCVRTTQHGSVWLSHQEGKRFPQRWKWRQVPPALLLREHTWVRVSSHALLDFRVDKSTSFTEKWKPWSYTARKREDSSLIVSSSHCWAIRKKVNVTWFITWRLLGGLSALDSGQGPAFSQLDWPKGKRVMRFQTENDKYCMILLICGI